MKESEFKYGECDGYNHKYSDWACEKCGRNMCWNCAVNCVDDGTGEGPITCPHCGADNGYYK